MLTRFTRNRPHRAKLIFNPGSGMPGESPARLVEAITALQDCRILPEVYTIQPGRDLRPVVQDALRRGIRLVIACGGDGTVDAVASAIASSRLGALGITLGIIPAGTQNNVALSLGIPQDIAAAASRLRAGKGVKVDLGLVTCGGVRRTFLEVCSVGLFSALFPSVDDIQHGNLARLGDFLSTLVTSPEAGFHLKLDGEQEIEMRGHVVLVSNMPYIGPHYQVSPAAACDDGLLDVLVFANLTLLDLVGYAVLAAGGATEDPRVQHYHARRVEIDTHPPMPVLADGFTLGSSPLTISTKHQALTVMV